MRVFACVYKNMYMLCMLRSASRLDTSHACIVRTREACMGVWQHVKKYCARLTRRS